MHRLPNAWYKERSDSKLSMLCNGKVQIEVTIWKRDESVGGSPLAGYTYLWKEWDVYLSMSLADLQRDSDGDGLTDLFEERILTDPNSSDTDSDGLPDASDNQPLTPFPKHMTDSDEIVLSLIPKAVTRVIRSIFPLGRHNDSSLVAFDERLMGQALTAEGLAYFTSPHSERIPPDCTRLIVSASGSFPHVTGESRVIVLDQHAAVCPVDEQDFIVMQLKCKT